ncbi:MAG: GMC family oxidoreductase [Verrucomicrobia bacterium]|nr:GMC family oxidoreductase [Verrucomicrobiota bacterium]
METTKTQILVIGSGAGGAVTAATLAEAGRQVTVIEEGPSARDFALDTNTPEAMRLLYRNGGLCPILGQPTSAFIEGCCVGGSTEINSAFWHRTPPDVLDDWRRRFQIEGLSAESMEPVFQELEQNLGVRKGDSENLPLSSTVFADAAKRLEWKVVEVPRAQSADLTGSAYSAGAKNSMSRTYLPRAEEAGAVILSGRKAVRLERSAGKVTAVTVERSGADAKGTERFEAEYVFVCCGAVQTPVLLRPSGFRGNVGENLQFHPMVKVAAQFKDAMDGHDSTLPVYQVKEFAPEITLGGAVFTPGFLALTLSDNWLQNEVAMKDWRHMALYYATSCGKGKGTVRRMPVTGEALARYRFSEADRDLLNKGFVKLCELLFEAGATRIFPGFREPALVSSREDALRYLEHPIPVKDMSISVLHIFGSCSMGEDRERCAVDSFGKVFGADNLYVSDASIIPDAPGVNTQGTVMAFALRNARRFIESVK